MTKPGPYSGWEHALRAMAYTRRSATDSVRRGTEEAGLAVAAAPDLAMGHALYVNGLAVPVASQGAKLDAGLAREIQLHIERATQLDGDNPAVINWLLSGYAAL